MYVFVRAGPAVGKALVLWHRHYGQFCNLEGEPVTISPENATVHLESEC